MKSSTCPPKVFCATLLQPARMRPAPCPPPKPTRPAIASKIKTALCLSLPNQNSKITNGLCVFSRSPPNRTQPAAESKIQASQSPIKNQNSKFKNIYVSPQAFHRIRFPTQKTVHETPGGLDHRRAADSQAGQTSDRHRRKIHSHRLDLCRWLQKCPQA